jgi:hypothetical protein
LKLLKRPKCLFLKRKKKEKKSGRNHPMGQKGSLGHHHGPWGVVDPPPSGRNKGGEHGSGFSNHMGDGSGNPQAPFLPNRGGSATPKWAGRPPPFFYSFILFFKKEKEKEKQWHFEN